MVGSLNSWAEEEVYYTLNGTTTGGSSGYDTESTITQNGMTWKVKGNTTQNPWRIGGKNLDGVDREAYSETAMGDAITKIELELGGITITANSITLIVASNSDFSTVLQTIEETEITQNNTLTFKPSGDNWATGAYYKLVFNVTETAGTNRYVQLKSLKFYHTAAAATVKTPTFDPVAGTYTTAKNVTISCATDGATIRYTTNGDEPTESSTIYTEPVSVTLNGTVLKAKAFKAEMTASSVASATYNIVPTTPTIVAAGATVTITGDAGCTFYYTIDGTAPTNLSTEYLAPFNLDADCTIKAIAYDTYGNTSAVKSYTYKYFPLNPKNINSGYFEKVTDVSALENGDAILIVNEGANIAMSTTQNSNNRGAEDVTISGNVIYAPSADVQKIVIVKATEEIAEVNTDVFYFYVSSTEVTGYLYASSGSSNQLKTETSPDANNNARATITIDGDGNASITFTGKNARNVMQYNSSSNIFACYASASQSAFQIYKEVAHNVPAVISTAEYATFNSDYALDFSATGITAYTATAGAKSVTLNEVSEGKVPANTPVVLYKASADGTAINVPVIPSAPAVGDNDLHVSTGTDVADMYVLSKKGGVVGFYKWNGATDLSAGKVYLQATTTAPEFLGFGDATGIEAVKAQANDSQVVYNLAGQRVAQPTKGLYIVNGKKVIIK